MAGLINLLFDSRLTPRSEEKQLRRRSGIISPLRIAFTVRYAPIRSGSIASRLLLFLVV